MLTIYGNLMKDIACKYTRYCIKKANI